MKKTIKGKKIPHLVEPQFYNMEFDPAEVEEMQAIHDANPKNLKFSPKKEAELKEMFSKAVKETKEKKAISIRLSNADINGVKKIAERE
jgi:predicted DNA binding CopG/RHH family protein